MRPVWRPAPAALFLCVLSWVLILGACSVVHSVHAAEPEVLTTRVTYYTLRGVMASGQYTQPGAAACSRWMPFGTQLMLPDGYVVTCLDRGHGDYYWSAWLDVWAPSAAWGRANVEATYGTYTTVTVIRWGWGD